MSTISPITRPIYSAIKWFSNTRIAKHAGSKVFANDRKFIDGLGVASIVAKDGLGCYLYVTQSLNNKDIPDDKRKFVASLDLTNGLLMIALQILMFKTVSNKVTQTKMFDKVFGKIFDRPLRKTYRKLTKASTHPDVTDIKYAKEFAAIRDKVRDAFGGLISLVAATIVGKRMLVPFIATPLAGTVEKYMQKKDAFNKTDADKNKQVEDKSKPSMQGNLNIVSPATMTNPAQVNTDTNLLAKFKQQ